nr:TRAP transporter substrate-binding protein DctP [uncultured Sphaerochaeta sp.]
MKKITCILIISLLMIPMLFANGQSEKTDGKAAEVTQLTLAIANPASDPWAQGLAVFAEELKKLSGGTMIVDCYFGGQLYNASNLLGAIRSGKIDFAGYSMGTMPEIPYLGMFQAAYLFRDAQHAQDFYNGEVGQKIFDEIEEKIGLTIVGTAYVGTRQVSLAKKLPDIKTPEDLKNVTLRMPGGSSWAALAGALGANPVPIALNEVFMALKTGVVDGQDNALPTTKANSFDEVIDQLVLTEHVVWNLHLAVNAKRWNQFSDQQKEWIREASQIGCDFTTNSFLATEQSLKEEFEQKGIRIVTPNKKAFIDYAENFYRNMTDESKNWDWEIYDALKNY